MSLPVPLAVRLKTNRSDRHITRDLRDLTFRETAYGGYASATMSLHRPLAWQPDEIAHYARVYVYDARHGGVVWEGRLEDPGPGVGADGQIWDLAAMGPSAHAADRTIPYVAIDSTGGQWRRAVGSTKHIQVEVSGGENGEITMRAPSGTAFNVGQAGIATYSALYEAGMEIGNIIADWDVPATNANLELRLYTAAGVGTAVQVDMDQANSAGGSLSGVRGGIPAITSGHDVVQLQFVRVNTNVTANENYWCEFSTMIVKALFKDLTGANITADVNHYTLASTVVTDLLGRGILDQYDAATASITTTSHHIDQCAYPDGATPRKIIEDLLELEPTMRWGAYESNSAGKHRFEFVAWPSTVKYEADLVDGFDSPSSARDLYNKVRVRWIGPGGLIRSTVATLDVPALTAAGLTREGYIDLGDEIGSSANATQAATQFLADHSVVQSGGRVTIARPVYDLGAGRMVQPYELRAGQLIRLRGLTPSSSGLAATARDGITTYRIVAKDYRASSAAAELELDEYTRTAARPRTGYGIDFGGRRGRRRR